MKSVIKKTCPEPVEWKRNQKNRTAFSLVELLVVLGIIAILVGLSMPAINAMQKSFDSTGAEGMISTALATARTLAISHHKYAGVRFQTAFSGKGSLEADQYMIFVIYGGSDITTLDCGFVAVDGYKPMKLPANVGVMDKMVRISHNATPKDCDKASEGSLIAADLDDSTNQDPSGYNYNITDISTFSVVFSPSGKLVYHEIRVRNRHGKVRPPDLVITGLNPKGSTDTVFNSVVNIIDNHTGQFIQDDYDDYGVGVESSRAKFVIYDREKFKNMTTSSQRWDYLNGLKPVYINPYTGGFIEK